MALCKLLTLLSIIAMASAGMVVHESRTSAPAGFVSQGVAPANDMLTLRVALTSNNIAGLEEKLMSLSTPGSPEFRQWLSMEEVKSFVQPSSETVSAFSAFASANGLEPTVISPNGDWVSITLPVSQANQLFATQFEVFTHPDMSNTITRTLSVSLPSELVGHIDVIHPTTQFIGPNTRLAPASSISLDRRAVAASCNSSLPSGIVTPTCLQELYGIPATPATEKTNSLLVTAYEDEFAQTADLSEFLKLLRPDIPSTTTFTLLSTDGGINTQKASDAGTEANLDIQYTTAPNQVLRQKSPFEFLSVGGDDFGTSLLDTTTFLDGVATPPSVMTTSYADNEADFGISMATYVTATWRWVHRGISVMFASGDGGVRGGHDSLSVCDDNTFMPVFPGTCPFVTAVGSTQGFGPEKAINFTGGGFSNFFPLLASFLKTIPSDFAGTFNKSGRAYPDASVQGWNFEIVSGGEVGLVGGTSASSPTFAAIIALINDRLIAAGKPVLGFLNPFIYSTASTAFTDITIGHNSGFVCPASSVAFDAAVGWDALTGFGTPIFSEILAAAMA
ncbi:family S53 protease-like protein [Gymnopus androsaceus JB14]|uniref:Family S53 protease-like protein n=1 Tax=Gymnopus androsaceus JB14 TaxID=1447944 RepID=A0A6A4GV11_9AGAR|nr:family S53 protease-like protein [Gymnopus androsaceus JB14]